MTTHKSSCCAKRPVAGVPQARDDIALFIHFRIDDGCVHLEACKNGRAAAEENDSHICGVPYVSVSADCQTCCQTDRHTRWVADDGQTA